MKLSEVVVYVKDVPEAIRYYRDVLGLPLVWEYDGVAELDAGGVKLHLHDLEPEGVPRAPLPCFHAEDIDAEVAELNARGAGLPGIVDEGWGRIVRFTDPEGNKLCIERPHE
jgi:catechol 2,3-dioxygenase-like lactoylglutathione lyase family enzyme